MLTCPGLEVQERDPHNAKQRWVWVLMEAGVVVMLRTRLSMEYVLVPQARFPTTIRAYHNARRELFNSTTTVSRSVQLDTHNPARPAFFIAALQDISSRETYVCRAALSDTIVLERICITETQAVRPRSRKRAPMAAQRALASHRLSRASLSGKCAQLSCAVVIG